MKLLTLNTHSLEEKDYEKKLKIFTEEILKEKPDVIALQEVNQPLDGEEADGEVLKKSGFIPCPSEPPSCAVPVRLGNHGLRAVQLLRRSGFPVFWTWTSAKVGYGKYDEGMALMSRRPIAEVSQLFLTDGRDYNNWKTRKALAITLNIGKGEEPVSFVTAHMGWWKDEEEPFSRQWERLDAFASSLRRRADVWLMGDFNTQDSVRGEGYDRITASGWTDAYRAAGKRDGGITVPGAIDGWREDGEVPGMRIDYIWYGRKHDSGDRKSRGDVVIEEVRTVFNGSDCPAVSDHFGVLAECRTPWDESTATEESELSRKETSQKFRR